MNQEQMQKDVHVRLNKLTKKFGNVVAVCDLDLELAYGEFLAMLGPSGSGKTTTLMLVAGFEMPTSGEIFIDGRDVTKILPEDRGIGMVFQNYALFPHMTIFQNIAFPLKIRGIEKSEIRERVEAALHLVRLPAIIDRYPSQISGGQQQRVALARALVFRPSLLLMDEPLGALDRKLREQMQFEIKRIQEELKISVIYVTHDQSEAMAMADRVAVFNEGKLCQLGAPEGLYQKPANEFVAGFLGESNFLEVTINPDGSGCLRDGTRINLCVEEHVQSAQRGRLVLRPERMRISPVSNSSENGLIGIVDRVTFLGSVERIVIQISTGEMMIINKPNEGAVGSIQKGERVFISWDPDNAHFLPLQ